MPPQFFFHANNSVSKRPRHPLLTLLAARSEEEEQEQEREEEKEEGGEKKGRRKEEEKEKEGGGGAWFYAVMVQSGGQAKRAQGIEVERAPAESKKRIILNGWHLTFNVSRHARVHARARGVQPRSFLEPALKAGRARDTRRITPKCISCSSSRDSGLPRSKKRMRNPLS